MTESSDSVAGNREAEARGWPRCSLDMTTIAICSCNCICGTRHEIKASVVQGMLYLESDSYTLLPKQQISAVTEQLAHSHILAVTHHT